MNEQKTSYIHPTCTIWKFHVFFIRVFFDTSPKVNVWVRRWLPTKPRPIFLFIRNPRRKWNHDIASCSVVRWLDITIQTEKSDGYWITEQVSPALERTDFLYISTFTWDLGEYDSQRFLRCWMFSMCTYMWDQRNRERDGKKGTQERLVKTAQPLTVDGKHQKMLFIAMTDHNPTLALHRPDLPGRYKFERKVTC